MEGKVAQSKQGEDLGATYPPGSISVGHYEAVFDMTTQMLAVPSIEERALLALDTLTAGLGWPQAAIALIDEKNAVLRMRMALGFNDNLPIETIRMPLDSAAAGVSAVYDGRTMRVTTDLYEHARFSANAAGSDFLALPLFGIISALDKPDEGLARRQFGESKYWEPEGVAVGVLYVGAPPSMFNTGSMALLSRFADRIGVLLAAAMRGERLAATVKRLKLERQWVESIMKSVADPIVLTNLDNEILLQNKRAEELFSGWHNASEGKRQALKMNDLLFSAYLSSVAVASNQTLDRDLTLVDPIEGSDRHFEVVSTPAVNEEGQRIGLVSVFRDMTDLQIANEELARNYQKLKHAEAAGRRERDRLNLIIENVGHPIVVTGSSGNFILCNYRAALFFQEDQALKEGRHSAEEGGRDDQILAAVRANSVKLTSFISSLASEPSLGRQGEIELRDPQTGESLPMEITSVQVLESRGQVTAVVSVLHDLSEIRELERRRVEQKLFESEKLAVVGTLAASIAHEINNPLEAIKNSLHLLQSSRGDDEDGRFLKIAAKETERVSYTIRQLLGFTRHSGTVESTDLNNLITETLTLVERRLHNARINVSTALDPGLPEVQCYPGQLRQVLLNLILNAEQSIEKLGRIDIRTGRQPLSGQPAVTIEIGDTGGGISESDMSHIFEPFFSTRQDGTGLGLWVSHNIVRQHGGRIDVTSQKNGTTFKVVIPVESPTLTGTGK
jgi:PAS domain S-box-containing protein